MTRISAIVLAAGRARRFGSTKQLTDVDGRPLVRLVVETTCAAHSFDEVIVVVGHDAGAVQAALAGLPVLVAPNPRYDEGQSASVRAGLACVAPTSAGAMFVPADQPGLTPAVLDTLAKAFEQRPEAIIVPVYAGRRGSPVVFPRDLFPELHGLQGDVGGRALLARFESRLHEVPFDTTAPLADVDTPEDRDRWLRSRRS
jgi:molybdenum cofactor cytidylyltransferase